MPICMPHGSTHQVLSDVLRGVPLLRPLVHQLHDLLVLRARHQTARALITGEHTCLRHAAHTEQEAHEEQHWHMILSHSLKRLLRLSLP